MKIDVTDEQTTALRLIGVWHDFMKLGRHLDGDEPIPDDAVVLHYSGNGASAMVTWSHLRDVARIDTKTAVPATRKQIDQGALILRTELGLRAIEGYLHGWRDAEAHHGIYVQVPP